MSRTQLKVKELPGSRNKHHTFNKRTSHKRWLFEQVSFPTNRVRSSNMKLVFPQFMNRPLLLVRTLQVFFSSANTFLSSPRVFVALMLETLPDLAQRLMSLLLFLNKYLFFSAVCKTNSFRMFII